MSTTKEETRSHLLKAARKLLVERGFHGVGLEDIAAAAGVSRQAVYKSHFTSKADLLLALVQHMHVAEKLDELTRPVLEARSALAMFDETILAIVKIEGRVLAHRDWCLSAATRRPRRQRRRPRQLARSKCGR